MIPSGRSGIWSDEGMMTNYRYDREEGADAILGQEAKERTMASKATPAIEPGTGTAQGALSPASAAPVIPEQTSRVSDQATAAEEPAATSKDVGDTGKRGATTNFPS
jgi:hypothetical protein